MALYAAYRNELSKLILRKKYIVFLIFGALVCIIWVALAGVASNLVGQFGGVFINLMPTPTGVLPFFLRFIIPLLIFMSVTDLITAEGAENTMKAMLCRPVERWKLYTGKLLAVLTYTAIYLVCVFVVSAVLNQSLSRTLDFRELLSAFLSYGLSILPLAVLISFAAFVALFGRSTTLTMLSLIALFFVMNILPIIFPIFNELLFTAYLGWHRLWIGVLPEATRLIHSLIILISYGVVFYMAGSLVFERKEY